MTRKSWNIIGVLLLVLLIEVEAIFVYRVITIDLLPTLYLAALIVLLLAVTVLMGMFLIPGRRSKGRLPRRIFSALLAVILCAGCLVGSSALNKAENTMQSVTSQNTVRNFIGVYVLADDPAQSIADAAGYTFAVTESYDWDNTRKALNAMEQELGRLEVMKLNSVYDLVEALYSGTADALLLNTAYADLLADTEGYTDFATRTRMLHESTVEVHAPDQADTDDALQSTHAGAADESGIVAPFIIYLSGSDSRSKVLPTNGRSDVNILAVVNPTTKQALLVNTPRDYYIENPAARDRLDKLTHCGIYGVDNTMQALSQLYGVPIDFNARVNFSGFETLVDAIGGVTIYSDVSVNIQKGDYHIDKGENVLDGPMALAYARERYAFAGGDNTRGQNQMKLIKAIISKMLSGTLLTRYSQILDSMETMFSTSVPQQMISDIVKMQLTDMASWEIHSFAVTGYGASKTTASTPNQELSVMIPFDDTVAQASDLIQRVLAGEILTEADLVIEE